jgi:hypothetical protein
MDVNLDHYLAFFINNKVFLFLEANPSFHSNLFGRKSQKGFLLLSGLKNKKNF